MIYDLSGLVPFLVAFVVLAAVGVALAVGAFAVTLAEHHRTRVTRQQSIPTYYRHVLLAH